MSTADFTSAMFPAVYTPQTSLTLDEFRSWVHSDDFPRHGKVSYLQGQLYIETNPDQQVVEVPDSGMTLDDFREWVYSDEFPDRGRITFVEGRLFIDMSPERIEGHNQVKSALNRAIDALVREQKLGKYYPDGAWITNSAAGVSSEPDAMFASWETLKSGKLAPRKRRAEEEDAYELIGAPDWVCEVISSSTEKADKKTLVEAYHKAGIREYWLIDARWANIEFTILVWEPAGYRSVEPRDGWLDSTVFGVSFRLVRERDDVGGWDYELQCRKL
jgi:Uma2 family endonuclease